MTTTEPRLIEHTNEPMRHPWPADCYVQGGDRGVVLTEDGSYWTAFVEAFPGTFIRGEGVTIADAEDVPPEGLRVTYGVTIEIEGGIPDAEIRKMIDHSYDLVAKKKKRQRAGH